MMSFVYRKNAKMQSKKLDRVEVHVTAGHPEPPGLELQQKTPPD
jgi:hypothetical protein